MSKHGTDEQGWPLVPYDPKGIPDGYEVVRVGWPEEGDSVIAVERETNTMLPCKVNPNYIGRRDSTAMTIIRPVQKPIRLPLAIVPNGWWVAKDDRDGVWVYSSRPSLGSFAWINEGPCGYKLPPWIAAQLPREWHNLPWDKSAMQQTEGGEG